jgi:hypothetical protein
MLVPLLVLAATFLSDPPPFAVRVDSARHEVIMTMGPVHVAPTHAGASHAEMHPAGHDLPMVPFAWPVAGWVRGFRIRIYNADGAPLSRRMLHHVNLLNLERRRLTEPVFERTLAAGQETADVMLPSSLGVRIDSGTEMAILAAFVNETGEELHDVTLEVVVVYLPDDRTPRPREIRPIDIDLSFRAGSSSGFDVGPGRTVYQRDFTLPVSGRLLGVGGHLHDYAESIALIDMTTGKQLFKLKTRRDSAGHVLGVGRKLYLVIGNGLKLHAEHSYRVVAIYDNPFDRTLVDGGMASLGGIFAPDNPALWPPLDRSDPAFIADKGALDRLGAATVVTTSAGGHEHEHK